MKVPDSGLKEKFEDLYLKQRLSYCEIAERLSISPVTVWRKLKLFGIPQKTHKGRLKSVTKEELDYLYWGKGFPLSKIAKLYQVRVSSISDRMQLLGIPRRSRENVGSKNGSWKGGRCRLKNGYVLILVAKDNPFYSMATNNNYVPEHRLAMAQFLGRPVESWEVVHHINGVKDDNRIENLELLPSQSEHTSTIHMQITINDLTKETRLLRWQIKELREEVKLLKQERVDL